MNNPSRFPLLLLAAALLAAPGRAQEALPLSNFCTFTGEAPTEEVYVFSSSEVVRDAVESILKLVGLPLEIEVRAANVETFVAATKGDRRFVLYDTYFAERLANKDWIAWARLAHALAHHIQNHTLTWERDRPLQEIDADQLTGAILFRLGIPLDALQGVAPQELVTSNLRYPTASLRRAAMTEGWSRTNERNDRKLSYAFTGQGEGADIGYPSFWPPPQASVQTVVPLNFQDNGKSKKLGEIAHQLKEALDASGYHDLAYYAVPDGFALVARLEQIHADGTPKDLPERWSLEVKPMSKFSLTSYFRALFAATPGYFRIVAFVVTSKPFAQKEAKVGREEAQAWLDSGLNVLPASIASLSATEAHTCTALVYTFEQPTRDDPVRFVDPSPIPARSHLQKAGLWTRFQEVGSR